MLDWSAPEPRRPRGSATWRPPTPRPIDDGGGRPRTGATPWRCSRSGHSRRRAGERDADPDDRQRRAARAGGRRRRPACSPSCGRSSALTGSKNACEEGECGSCTVWLEASRSAPASSRPCRRTAGTSGRSRRSGRRRPLPVQDAFLAAGAVQCGFCTPGLVVAATDLLARDPFPPTTRSGRRCPATSAAAPGTRRSSTRVHVAAGRARRSGCRERRRGERAARRRRAEGDRRVHVWQRPPRRRDAVRRHAPEPLCLRPRPLDRDRRGASGARRPRRPDRGGRAGAPTFGLERADQPVLAARRRPLRGRAGRPRRRGDAGAGPGRRRAGRGRVRAAAVRPRHGGGARAGGAGRARRRQRPPPRPHRARRPRRRRARCVGRGTLRDPDAGSGPLGPEAGRSPPLHPTAASSSARSRSSSTATGGRSRPCLDLPEERRSGRDRGRRRRVRVARGRPRADPRLPARAADEPAGEDRLRARGVVPRPRAPAPVADLDSVRGDERRPPRCGRRPAAARRRRLRLLLPGRPRQCVDVRRRAVRVPNVRIEGTAVFTNNPPCGAMRGFGAPQVCFAYESAWTRSPRSSASTRSSCAGGTSCGRARSCPPARC